MAHLSAPIAAMRPAVPLLEQLLERDERGLGIAGAQPGRTDALQNRAQVGRRLLVAAVLGAGQGPLRMVARLDDVDPVVVDGDVIGMRPHQLGEHIDGVGFVRLQGGLPLGAVASEGLVHAPVGHGAGAGQAGGLAEGAPGFEVPVAVARATPWSK